MRDYWLNKLFFDIQQPAVSAEYKKDREAVLARYPMAPELRKALLADDIETIAPHANAYLLRFYFQVRGMPQDEFMARLHAMNASGAPETARVGHG